MFSNLKLGMSVIPLVTEGYECDKFRVLEGGVDWGVVSKPSELPWDYLISEGIKSQIEQSGSYYLSPFSFNWNQFSRVYSLLANFKRWSNSVMLSSCRVDAVARDRGLVDLISYFGSSSMVCAIEGISERICNFLQKSLMKEELLTGMEHIVNSDFKGLKLYYIFTGLEGDADVLEFEEFLGKLDDMRRKAGKPTLPIKLSFTPLLSTLGTPLQYHGSKVSRTLRGGSDVLYRIKIACTRYGFGLRLSTSLAATDFAQMIEFMDRRGQSLLEYASINGVIDRRNYSVSFYELLGEITKGEITKGEYRGLKGSERHIEGDRYYRIRTLGRVTVNKLFLLANSKYLYPEYSVLDIMDELEECERVGKPSDRLISWLPMEMFKGVGEGRLRLIEQGVTHYLYRYPNGRGFNHLIMNLTISDTVVEELKRLLPMFTNGVTFNDLIENRTALHIFPGSHIKFHRNRHIGQDFRQYLGNAAKFFDSYCHADALGHCHNCGTCETVEEIKHITQFPGGVKETGVTSFGKILDVVRDDVPRQKLLLEVRIDKGRYGAMSPNWLRFAITRAVLKASKGRLTEANLHERFAHTRQGFKIKQEYFKSIIAGSFIFEMNFNSRVDLEGEIFYMLKEGLNEYVTRGWKFTGLRMMDTDFTLKGSAKYAAIAYRFDSRKVKGMSLSYLESKVRNFFDSESKMFYKAQLATGRFTARVEEKDFDKSRIVSASVGVGSSEFETFLKVFVRLGDVHPLVFLSGFLGSGEESGDKPRGYVSLYGTDIVVGGYYDKPLGVEGLDVFGVLGDGVHSSRCPRCSGLRFVNLISGLPFGGVESETDALVLEKYGRVCQSCFAELTN